jgi:hypothetical protein
VFAAARDELGFGRKERDGSIVLLTVMFVLLVSRYGGSASQIQWLLTTLDGLGLDRLADRLDHAINESVHRSFNGKAYFAIFRIVVYVVPTYAVGRWVLRVRMSDLGWNLDRNWYYVKIFVGFYLVMLPLVVIVSRQPAFQDAYPYYRPNEFESVWPWFVLWQVLYFAQFVTLELFLRGFGVRGLARSIGYMAIPVMTVPYMMQHFGKTVWESVGAIIAGVALGIVSLRKGSAVWGGVLHWAVAVTMDLLVY